jgi:hypothetical protein
MLRAILLCLCLSLASAAAFAHSWYDVECCSGKDCEPIDDTAVTMHGDGYHVHYTSSAGFEVWGVVPYDKARMSHDGHYHGCASFARFLCLYVPANV